MEIPFLIGVGMTEVGLAEVKNAGDEQKKKMEPVDVPQEQVDEFRKHKKYNESNITSNLLCMVKTFRPLLLD